MNKKLLTAEVSRPILMPIRLLHTCFLISLISTPFIWIWINFELTWKVGLSAIIGISLTTFFQYIIKRVCAEVVNDELKQGIKPTLIGSKFQKRVQRLMDEHNIIEKSVTIDSLYEIYAPYEQELNKISQINQTQTSLKRQMFILRPFANKLGLYDAADYLKT